MHASKRRGGFTIVELIVVLVVVIGLGLFAAIVLPAVSSPRCGGGRQTKDASQVRGIVQAMAIWAQNNKDFYPLPSLLDVEGNTVAGDADAKNTTANIFSILINNGSLSPELILSPSEVNTTGIVLKTDYQYDTPKAATNPGKALWDPSLGADFATPGGSNISYAHMPPVGARLAKWFNTFSTLEAAVGNRGPQIANVTRDASGDVSSVAFDTQSNTLRIHGSRTTWEGNIGYNDGHVNFETKFAPDGLTYIRADKKAVPDVLFVDEQDDKAADNNYLGVFTKAGPQITDFHAIWD
jgi:type II secretory pathway pseudopilin PulG